MQLFSANKLSLIAELQCYHELLCVHVAFYLCIDKFSLEELFIFL